MTETIETTAVKDIETEDYLWGQRHNVKYSAELSSLYHQKRERFFDLFDKLGKAIAVIGSSAVIAKITDPSSLYYLAAAITVTSTLSLVFSFSERARRHSELSAKFKDLLATIAVAGERDFKESDLNAWKAKVLQLEMTEPPALGTLVVLCQNELALARGQTEMVHPVGWFKSRLAHFIDLPAAG